MALDDELGALDTGGIGDVDGSTYAALSAAGELGDGVGLGMEHIVLRQSVLILTDVLESHGRAVVAVRDDALILDDQGADLAALAVGVLRPDLSHTQIASVECELLIVLLLGAAYSHH